MPTPPQPRRIPPPQVLLFPPLFGSGRTPRRRPAPACSSRSWRADQAFETHDHHHHHDWDRSECRSGFGVRRPLRFLAHKLDLATKNRSPSCGGILRNDLKTERAQAEVDDRRSLAEFADAISGESFDAGKAGSAWPAPCSEHGESSRGLGSGPSNRFTPS